VRAVAPLGVSPAASSDLQRRSRAADVTVKAASDLLAFRTCPWSGPLGVGGSARTHGLVRNRRHTREQIRIADVEACAGANGVRQLRSNDLRILAFGVVVSGSHYATIGKGGVAPSTNARSPALTPSSSTRSPAIIRSHAATRSEVRYVNAMSTPSGSRPDSHMGGPIFGDQVNP
jgi:hypothetical protein